MIKKYIPIIGFLATTVVRADSFHLVTPLEPVLNNPSPLQLRLAPATFSAVAGDEWSSSNLISLVQSYGQSISNRPIVLQASNLPEGLRLENNKLVGVPAHAGEHVFTLSALVEGVVAQKQYVLTTNAQLRNVQGAWSWSDNHSIANCNDYLQAPTTFHHPPETLPDGPYSIHVNGQGLNVYCDMSCDGGGWMLAMKQAQGDGVTLQGDTTYWTQGTVLNDTLANLNKNDGNFVSAVFSQVPVTQFRLEAANETTMQYHSREVATAQVAFNDQNAKRYSDGNANPKVRPDWYVYTTVYMAGSGVGTAIGSARFEFNHFQGHPQVHNHCGARWGWTANEHSSLAGSHDYCGGLGGYGTYYGTPHMPDKNYWQPATLYLWIK